MQIVNIIINWGFCISCFFLIQILIFGYQELTLLISLFFLISWLVLSSSIKFLNAFAMLQIICQCLVNNFLLDSICLLLSTIFSCNYLADLGESTHLVSGIWWHRAVWVNTTAALISLIIH